MVPVPASRRLRFDLAGDDDAAFVAHLHADKRVARQLVDGVPDTEPKARIFLAWSRQFDMTGYGNWIVRHAGTGKPIGLFSLIPFDNDPLLLELGGKLVPSAWGGGLALEAGRAVIEHGLDALDRDHLVSAVHPDNRSATRALLALGFEPAGRREVFGREVSLLSLSRQASSASRSDYGQRAA